LEKSLANARNAATTVSSPQSSMTPTQILQEGMRLHQSGRLNEAEARYRQLLALDSKHAEALHYLGLLAYQGKRLDDAVRLVSESIAVDPKNVAAHNNLGNALAMLGRHREAEAAFRNSLALDPNAADTWFNLANSEREQQRFDDADATYRRVIALRPNHIGALSNLAKLNLIRGRKIEAAEAFNQLGDAVQGVGRTSDAAGAYQQALSLSANPGYEVKLAFLTPVLPMSVDEIERTRERLFAGVDSLAAKANHLADPLRYATSAIFYTGYHGRNDRELRQRFADFYLRASPELAWRAPHCAEYLGPRGRIRVGFISRNFHRDHPMTKLFGGIIGHLDRGRFDVTMFRFNPPPSAPVYRDTKVSVLAEDLAAARRTIAEANLDVLFYTDIGMEPLSYFLAFSRLAPVQCVTFGHPITSGIPNVDYFLSANDMETAEAQDHYTEALIPLSTIPVFFKAPSAAVDPPTRADLGLPAEGRIYFCAQNLIKFHPDFDAVLARIMKRDPKGVLVLINNNVPQLGQLLIERLRRAMPDAPSRVAMLPFLKLDVLLGFVQSVDAVLDTPVFCGGTTSLEMFAVDVPIVTWPSAFARGRITHALYRQMQLDGLTAKDADDYVEMSLRLASDRAWRSMLREALRQKKHVLYENSDLVLEIERFFAVAVAAAAEKRKLSHWTPDIATFSPQ
jgi:predicted O-linked N-acetylglucosamine transferase (SPINDLY family)